MKSNNLLMVTTGYPYGQGESFVAAELAYMGQTFDTVTLVPCFFTPDKPPRDVAYAVDLAYARARWGAGRVFHVIKSFVEGLWRYKWLGEADYILRHAHRLENLKELARTLYRARLFERFLERQQAAGKHYDLVYFYWIVPEIAGALSFRQRSQVGEVNRSTIVARAHGGDLYEERRPGGYAGLTDVITTGLDAVFCISEHGKGYLIRKYPSLVQHFHLARLGVDDPGFVSPQPEDDALSILSCSFMVPGKRLHLIIEAIAVLLTQNPDLSVRWTHIGDGELFQQLQAQVARILDGRRLEVIFKGYMQQSDVVAFYRDSAFDVIINVSDCEGIPVSLMEASSAGIPMIATDVGGSGEIVNADNGVLIHEDADAATIAAALLKFYDRRLAAAYRVRALAYWQTHFNAQTNYGQFGQALLRSMEHL
jgi:colanic acid/amylovoran biosynthesis glycosyltransferase